MRKINSPFLTLIIASLLSIVSLHAQKNINLFFEGEVTSRGISVYDCQLLVIDQTGFHTYIPVKNKFKFSITPNRKFVIAALKPGFVPEIIILNANTEMLTNGSHSIQKKFSISQYDPTSEKWTQMTKFGQINYNANSNKFLSVPIALSPEDKQAIVQLLFDEKYTALKNAVMAHGSDALASKLDSVFSAETKALKAEVRALQINELQAQNNAKSAKKGMIYSLQIGAYSKSVSPEHPLYNAIPNLTYSLDDDGIYRYRAGEFKSIDDALNYKDDLFNIGITEAFVVARFGGKRMTIPSRSDTIRNKEIDKWHLKVRKIEAEIDYLSISKTRLLKEQVLIEKELEEINDAKGLKIAKADTVTRKKNLKQIALNIKKNNATLGVKDQKLSLAKAKLREKTKNEILSDDGKIRTVLDTIFVDKDIVANYPRKQWIIGLGKSTLTYTGSLLFNSNSNMKTPYLNESIFIGRKLNRTFSAFANYEIGSFLVAYNDSRISDRAIAKYDYNTYTFTIQTSISQLMSKSKEEKYWDFGITSGGTILSGRGVDIMSNALTGGFYYEQVLFPRLLMSLNWESSIFIDNNINQYFDGTTINNIKRTEGLRIKFAYNFDIILKRKTAANGPGKEEIKL